MGNSVQDGLGLSDRLDGLSSSFRWVVLQMDTGSQEKFKLSSRKVNT